MVAVVVDAAVVVVDSFGFGKISLPSRVVEVVVVVVVLATVVVSGLKLKKSAKASFDTLS